MARPRKPIELQSRKLSKDEIENRKKAELELTGDRDKLLTPPSWLKTKDEKKIYKELVKELIHIKSLGNPDREIFAVMANAKYMMIKANLVIGEYGELIKKYNSRTGEYDLVENPAIKIYKTYEAIFRSNHSQVGMGASSRSKLAENIVKETKKTKMEKMFGGLRG